METFLWLDYPESYVHSPETDLYSTFRNGDLILCECPAGTPYESLPKTACGYKIFKWIFTQPQERWP